MHVCVLAYIIQYIFIVLISEYREQNNEHLSESIRFRLGEHNTRIIIKRRKLRHTKQNICIMYNVHTQSYLQSVCGSLNTICPICCCHGCIHSLRQALFSIRMHNLYTLSMCEWGIIEIICTPLIDTHNTHENTIHYIIIYNTRMCGVL